MSLRDTHNRIFAEWVKRQHVDAITINRAVIVPPPGDRFKSAWERQYAQHLELRKYAGEVREFWYEALKFKLADDAAYTPDFVVWFPDDHSEVHEIKGHKRAAAMVRFRVAREKFPSYTWRMLHKQVGRWIEMKV